MTEIDLENYFEIKRKVIEHLEKNAPGDRDIYAKSFTKKDLFLAVGLKKSNPEFDKFWQFLLRSSGQYLVKDSDKKNHYYYLHSGVYMNNIKDTKNHSNQFISPTN